MIDLHTHSTASDGSCSPSELLSLAHERGLSAIALTDHDTVGGIPEFLEAAKKFPSVAAVPGVELSVKFREFSVHVLGLFVNYEAAGLKTFLRELRKKRDERNAGIVVKLRALGYDITAEDLKNEAKGESAGRPHIAKILMRKGCFATMQEVFDKCLKRGRPAYVPREISLPTDAIRAIHEAGGLAFWAHPGNRNEQAGRAFILKILKTLRRNGLDGIEAYYSSFSKEHCRLLLEIAAEKNILVSGGSDFHGANMDNVELGKVCGGETVPFSVYEQLLKCCK